MARLDSNPYPGPWASPKWDPVTHKCLVTDWQARWEDEKKALAALDAKSLIRGLRRQDVLDMLERERRLRSLFPAHGSR